MPRREYYKKYNAARRIARRDRSRRERGLPEPTRQHQGVCECCGRLPAIKPLMLDHDHITGAFRGWLCVNCNLGLGMLGDSEQSLQQALNYLIRARTLT
jgi:Recombination endonuclease VII